VGVEGLERQITGGPDFETLTDQAVGDRTPDRTRNSATV